MADPLANFPWEDDPQIAECQRCHQRRRRTFMRIGLELRDLGRNPVLCYPCFETIQKHRGR